MYSKRKHTTYSKYIPRYPDHAVFCKYTVKYIYIYVLLRNVS